MAAMSLEFRLVTLIATETGRTWTMRNPMRLPVRPRKGQEKRNQNKTMQVVDYINDTICEATDEGQEQDALLAAVMRGKVTLTYNPDLDALHLHREIPKMVDWYKGFKEEEAFNDLLRLCPALQPSELELAH